jgi:squalene synthase HpnC
VNPFLQPIDFIEKHGTRFSAWPLKDSLTYTRSLTKSHYENFQLASWLLPRKLRQDFFNIYAFCRWADDLGDESGSAERSLNLLHWWQEELAELYLGKTTHPVYVALQETVCKHAIPQEPFNDLIRAFVQDQTVPSYATHNELLMYCRYSANPVGHLVLHLYGYKDEERRRLSDFTCTALQLANFWQDVTRDWSIGRLYIPLDRMRSFDYSPEMFEEDLDLGRGSPSFRALMRELVEDTEKLFIKGLPLADQVDRRLAVDLELFSRSGMAILELIRHQNYDTIRHRPRLGVTKRLKLMLGVTARRLLGHRLHEQTVRLPD